MCYQLALQNERSFYLDHKLPTVKVTFWLTTATRAQLYGARA
jgi:hypothetical protein